MECVPVPSVEPETEALQVPELSVQVATCVLPERNLTEPLRVGALPKNTEGVPPVTVAVSLTDCDVVMEEAEALRLVELVKAVLHLVIRL